MNETFRDHNAAQQSVTSINLMFDDANKNYSGSLNDILN